MSNLIPVIITTSYRGVFFGFIERASKKETTLEVNECRNVRYWSSKTDGFQGLSSKGPNSDCRISAKAGGPTIIHNITSVTQCSDAATKVWEELK